MRRKRKALSGLESLLETVGLDAATAESVGTELERKNSGEMFFTREY